MSRDVSHLHTNDTIFFTENNLELVAVSPEHKLDRQLIIERLREKIANSEQSIQPVPSVESPEIITHPSSVHNVVQLQKCFDTDDTLSYVSKWPFNQVQTRIENGQRVYFVEHWEDMTDQINLHSEIDEVILNTQVTTTSDIVFQIPVAPVKKAQPLCVPSEIIGVDLNGFLIFNSSVATYSAFDSDTLIGYARDGFPIYGVYKGEVDKCGGYNHVSGYRYSISPDRDFILGCYVAIPKQFNL